MNNHEQNIGLSEFKEVDKKHPVFIIYRDNALYRNLVPKIVEEISSQGRIVEVHAIPESVISDEDVATELLDENIKKKLSESEVIWDNTTSKHNYGALKDVEFKHPKIQLDQLAEIILATDILGNDYIEKKPESRTFEDRLSALNNFVSKFIEQYPEINQISIIQSHISSHEFKPETEMSMDYKEEEILTAQKTKEKILTRFPNLRVEILEVIDNLPQTENTLFIYDRHAPPLAVRDQVDEEFSKGTNHVLMLPFASGIYHVVKTKELNIGEQNIEDNIKIYLNPDAQLHYKLMSLHD